MMERRRLALTSLELCLTTVSLACLVAPHEAWGNTAVAQVSAGYDHTCALKTDGSLWCWGDNAEGQLGDGTNTRSFTPVQVTSLGTSVAQVSARGYHTCARKTDGTLWCWGYNFIGQLGDGTTIDRSLPVQVTALGATVAMVSAGSDHTCAGETDGTLWCWGYDSFGELGDGTTTDSGVPLQVSALGAMAAALSAGGYHTCAGKTDGTLWCWGQNDLGQLGDGTTTQRLTPIQVTGIGATVAAVSAGSNHTCARITDGTVWCWGSNDEGQLGDGTFVQRLTPVMVAFPASPAVPASNLATTALLALLLAGRSAWALRRSRGRR